MAKPTISELQKQLTEYKTLFNQQIDEVTRLNKELDNTRNGLNVVSCAEFDGVLNELNDTLERYDILKNINEKLKKRIMELEISYGKVVESHDKLRDNYNQIEDGYLKQVKEYTKEIEELESMVVKIEHNARRAGRKRLGIDEKVIELKKQGAKIKEIAEELNVGTATVNRVLKRIKLT